MIWVERGWLPGLGWTLPDEFGRPDEFALTSDRAQFILEAGAYSGGYSGYYPPGRPADRPMELPHGEVVGVRGYGFNPSRWVQYRNLQGRRSGYRGYGATWDELANRVTLG